MALWGLCLALDNTQGKAAYDQVKPTRPSRLPAQVLFEGWMLGFRPVGDEAAAAVDKDLVEIDKVLSGYGAAWDAHVDAWLVIKARRPARAPGSSLLLARARRAARRLRSAPGAPVPLRKIAAQGRGVLVGAHGWAWALPGCLGLLGLLSAPGTRPVHYAARTRRARLTPLTCGRALGLCATPRADDLCARPPALRAPAARASAPARSAPLRRGLLSGRARARRWAPRSGCTAGAWRPSMRWRPRAAPA
jgi:hypothetical protein